MVAVTDQSMSHERTEDESGGPERGNVPGNLAEFFAASPFRGADVDLERLRDQPRPTRLSPAHST